MVADIGHLGTIWRPDGLFLLEHLVGGQFVELAAFHLVDIEQAGAAVGREIALDILLEVIAVDDEGFGSLLDLLVFLFFFSLRFGVFRDGEQQLPGIG